MLECSYVAVSAMTLLVGCQVEYPACKKSWFWRCYLKSRMVLLFWFQLTPVVLEKRPLNGCLSGM